MFNKRCFHRFKYFSAFDSSTINPYNYHVFRAQQRIIISIDLAEKWNGLLWLETKQHKLQAEIIDAVAFNYPKWEIDRASINHYEFRIVVNFHLFSNYADSRSNLFMLIGQTTNCSLDDTMQNPDLNSPSRKNPKPPLPKLKLFQIPQKLLERLGVNRSLLSQSHPFQARILMGCLILVLVIISHVLFIIYDAETFADYTQCTYSGSLGLTLLFVLLLFAVEAEKLFVFIGDCELMINSGESKRKSEISAQIRNRA